jgi:hypothetical protein
MQTEACRKQVDKPLQRFDAWPCRPPRPHNDRDLHTPRFCGVLYPGLQNSDFYVIFSYTLALSLSGHVLSTGHTAVETVGHA